MKIKNIIFDLGGVIINLEPEMAVFEFSKACGLGPKDLRKVINHNRGLFIDYETGIIDSETFRKTLCHLLKYKMSPVDFDTAWNSILGDVPEIRARLLEQLSNKYRLFLFSNTNDLHAQKVDEILALSKVPGLLGYFEKVYYSYLIQKRKPDPEAFLLILGENNLDPAETLFIDDTVENTVAAKKAGMQVLHVAQNRPELEFLLI